MQDNSSDIPVARKLRRRAVKYLGSRTGSRGGTQSQESAARSCGIAACASRKRRNDHPCSHSRKPPQHNGYWRRTAPTDRNLLQRTLPAGRVFRKRVRSALLQPRQCQARRSPSRRRRGDAPRIPSTLTMARTDPAERKPTHVGFPDKQNLQEFITEFNTVLLSRELNERQGRILRHHMEKAQGCPKSLRSDVNACEIDSLAHVDPSINYDEEEFCYQGAGKYPSVEKFKGRQPESGYPTKLQQGRRSQDHGIHQHPGILVTVNQQAPPPFSAPWLFDQEPESE